MFALELANIAERPRDYKPPSPEVPQVFLRSSTHPVAIWRQIPSLASTCFSLKTWKLAILAATTVFRGFSQNCSETIDAPPTHRCPWAHIGRVRVLARESHGAFFLLRQLMPRKSERPGNRLRGAVRKNTHRAGGFLCFC